MPNTAKNLAQIEFSKVKIENPTTKAATETEIVPEIYTMPKIYSEESMGQQMANVVGLPNDKPISSPTKANLDNYRYSPIQSNSKIEPQIYQVPRMYSGPIEHQVLNNTSPNKKLHFYDENGTKEIVGSEPNSSGQFSQVKNPK